MWQVLWWQQILQYIYEQWCHRWNMNISVSRVNAATSGVYNSPPLISVLRQINSDHTILLCLFKIHFEIILCSTPTSSKKSPFLFSYKNFICTSLPFPNHLTVLNFTPITFEKYKLWSSSLSNHLQLLDTSSFLLSINVNTKMQPVYNRQY